MKVSARQWILIVRYKQKEKHSKFKKKIFQQILKLKKQPYKVL